MVIEMVKNHKGYNYRLRLLDEDKVLADVELPEELYEQFKETPWGHLLEAIAERLGDATLKNLSQVELACLELNLAWLHSQKDTVDRRLCESAWTDRIFELRQREVASLMEHGEVRVDEM